MIKQPGATSYVAPGCCFLYNTPSGVPNSPPPFLSQAEAGQRLPFRPSDQIPYHGGGQQQPRGGRDKRHAPGRLPAGGVRRLLKQGTCGGSSE